MKLTLTLSLIIISFVSQAQSQYWGRNIEIIIQNKDTITQGEVLQLEVEIKNKGEETIYFKQPRWETYTKLNFLIGDSIAPKQRRKFKVTEGTKESYGDTYGVLAIGTSDCKNGYTGRWSTYVKGTNMPKMTFEYTTLDRGIVEVNGDGTFNFPFVNTGNLPLVISTVKSSCGCLVPSWDKEPVMPGDSGVIKSKYDTKRIGPINKSITVRSNAEHPITVLRIKGTVILTEEEKARRLKLEQERKLLERE